MRSKTVSSEKWGRTLYTDDSGAVHDDYAEPIPAEIAEFVRNFLGPCDSLELLIHYRLTETYISADQFGPEEFNQALEPTHVCLQLSDKEKVWISGSQWPIAERIWIHYEDRITSE